MRNPARIEPTLTLIRDFWSEHPDWRLGQILDGLAGMPCPSANRSLRVSVFYMEDDQLDERMQALRERVGGSCQTLWH